MPNLVGQSLGSATQILQSAGMRLGSVKVTAGATDAANPPQQTLASPSSLILSQDPPAGQKITAGSAVNFEVSR
jgi:beta-lactam-binding protein with PASTA domain